MVDCLFEQLEWNVNDSIITSSVYQIYNKDTHENIDTNYDIKRALVRCFDSSTIECSTLF